MKMSRDRLKQFESKKPSVFEDEEQLCREIVAAVAAQVKVGGDKHKALDEQWDKMYALAGVIMKNTFSSFMKQ
jgi:hypothetical protein